MLAVRFGSYSMCATLALTPSLSWRRKSITRYARLWPPPWCRMVIRPELLRPPRLCSGRTSDFSGSSRVISTKSATLAPRRPGVVGLYLRIPIGLSALLPEHVDAVAGPQRDDRALHVPAPAVAKPGALALAWPVVRIHVGDLDVEHSLHRDLDLRLVGLGVYVEGVLVLVEQAIALLRDDGSEQDVARVVEHQLSSFTTSSSDTAEVSSAGGATSSTAPFSSSAPSAAAASSAVSTASASDTGAGTSSIADATGTSSIGVLGSGPPTKVASAASVKTTSS